MENLVDKYLKKEEKLDEGSGLNDKEIIKDMKTYFDHRDTWSTLIKRAKKEGYGKKEADFLWKKMMEIETELLKISIRIGRAQGASKTLFNALRKGPRTDL